MNANYILQLCQNDVERSYLKVSYLFTSAGAAHLLYFAIPLALGCPARYDMKRCLLVAAASRRLSECHVALVTPPEVSMSLKNSENFESVAGSENAWV